VDLCVSNYFASAQSPKQFGYGDVLPTTPIGPDHQHSGFGDWTFLPGVGDGACDRAASPCRDRSLISFCNRRHAGTASKPKFTRKTGNSGAAASLSLQQLDAFAARPQPSTTSAGQVESEHSSWLISSCWPEAKGLTPWKKTDCCFEAQANAK